MKNTHNFPKPPTQTTYWLLGYSILMLCFWFIPPQLNYPWTEFLQLPINRFLLLITSSAIIWLVYEQLLSRRQRRIKPQKQHPDLIQQVRGAIRRLKTLKIAPPTILTKKSTQKKPLQQLPWLLAIGTPESGKTELLHKSGLNIILNKKNKTPSSNRYFECYATREAVIFDITEKLMPLDDTSHSSSLWQTFLQTCQRAHRPVFNGVIINLSIQQLTSVTTTHLNLLLAQHKKQLQLINQYLQKSIPIFISINHMDSLTGFNAFFGNLDAAGRDQAWGIALDQYQFSDINQLCERFDQKYDLLTQQLHDQLISKLHQEPHHKKRCTIEEYPLQMEAMKRPLARIMQYLSECFIDKNTLQLKGIYFTAAGNNTERIDRLLPAINKTFAITTELGSPAEQLNTYFARGLYTKIIFPSIWHQQLQMGWFYRYPNFRYACSLSLTSTLVITCTVIWTKQLSTNIQSVNTVNQNISQYIYQLSNNETGIKQTINGLDALSTAAKTLSKQPTSMLGIRIFKQQQLAELANIAYQNAVGAFLYHHLTATLEKIIANSGQDSAAQIYTGLKLYLQLIKHRPVDVKDFERWLSKNNTAFKSDSIQAKALRKHMQFFSNSSSTKIKINLPLIQQARQRLFDLPRNELALTMILQELAHDVPRREIPLQHINSMIPILTAKTNVIIPGIYSRESFASTYEQLIPKAAEMAMQGNWVTGKLIYAETIDMQQLMQQIADLYFEKYSTTWQTVLDELQLTSFTSYQHAIQVMDNFTKQNSPLYELLQIANYHTDVRYNDISTPISIKFQGIHKLFDAYGENSYFSMKSKIRKLQEIMATIANTPDHEKAAFVIAKQRMLSDQDDIFDELEYQAITLPAPLRQWVLKLNQSAWQLILNDARSYINTAWDKNVVDYYARNLQQYYPFDKNARKEIKLPEFNQFFAQLGIVDKFYLDYLAAFVDNDGGKLSWKKRNVSTLGGNNIFLANMQQMLGIRDTFFNQVPNQAQLEFTVQPLALQPIVKTSLFSVDEQQARFSHYAQVPQTFTWPSKQALHMTSLSIISIDGKQVKANQTGLWSLFRLLQQGEINPTQENNNVIVTFEIEGYGIQFEIMNNANQNPFNPQLFAGITLDRIV